MKKEEALAYLDDWLGHYSQDERVLRMRNFPHHPPLNAYIHSLRVVRKCVAVVNFFHLSVNWPDLLMAALLHDFYLYDFHEMINLLHGFNHPKKAAENAVSLFGVNKNVENAIRTHMFPLTISRVPLSREAWVLAVADKIVAIKEMLTRK